MSHDNVYSGLGSSQSNSLQRGNTDLGISDSPV